MTTKSKIALITGITGQDGAYLADFLLSKKYIVHGVKRRSSSFNTQRIDLLINDSSIYGKKFFLHHGDLTDTSSLVNLISKIKPNEIYNLAAQSHVAVSFEQPEYTSNSDALGTLRMLEAIRYNGLEKKTKFYQASTSELYGDISTKPLNENTPFKPRSPYAIAKLYAYWITVNYRESYNMFACNGILFNHESKLRGETFVSRKITRELSKIYHGFSKCLYLGNLNSKRDWGHAKDYVRMQWLMLQQKKAKDYVIATGKQYTVRNFVEQSCKVIGLDIFWKHKGLKEVGIIKKINFDICKSKNFKIGQILVRVDKKYFRPSEVPSLLGDASKAKRELGWKTTVSFQQIVDEMMQYDLNLISKGL